MDLAKGASGSDIASDIGLQTETAHLERSLFLSFNSEDDEAAFTRDVIYPTASKQRMRWWAIGMISFLSFNSWFYTTISTFSAAAIAVLIGHAAQFVLIQLLLLHPAMITNRRCVGQVGAIVFSYALLFQISLICSNLWRAGAWYDGDGYALTTESKFRPSDIHLIIFMILIQIFLTLMRPIHAKWTLWLAFLTPLVYFSGSFLEGWSPHSQFDVILQAMEVGLVSLCFWRGHRRSEIRVRLDWLHTRHLRNKVDRLQNKMTRDELLRQKSEEELMRRLEYAVRWELTLEKGRAEQDLIEFGWTEGAVGSKVKLIRKMHSQSFGVSVAYLLSDEFTEFAQRRTGVEDPSFRDVGGAIFMGADAVGMDVICPRDGELGCSYLDTLLPHQKGPCTHFLSWSWSYSLSTVQSSLQSWIAKLGERSENVYLWMCFFNNNQHRILKPSSKVCDGSDNLEEVFEENLLRIGKVVALLDTWMDPAYLTRIWCIFEQFIALKLGIKVTMILPPISVVSLIEQIDLGRKGILNVKENLSHVESQSAKASMPADEAKVKGLIQKSVGFDAVDKRVRESLIEWMGSEVQRYMAELVFSSHDRVQCPACNYQITWHRSHCCTKCSECPGEHDDHCDKKLSRLCRHGFSVCRKLTL